MSLVPPPFPTPYLAFNFIAELEGEPELTKLITRATVVRDKKGDRVIVEFVLSEEHYDYLHSMFGREFTISVSYTDNRGMGVVTKSIVSNQRVKWTEQQNMLDYGSETMSTLLVSLEYV